MLELFNELMQSFNVFVDLFLNKLEFVSGITIGYVLIGIVIIYLVIYFLLGRMR